LAHINDNDELETRHVNPGAQWRSKLS